MFKMIHGTRDERKVHGFKIHLSATKDNYKKLFELVYPLLLKEQVSFKYIQSDQDVLRNFSEYESPAESGKYITVYTNSPSECRELLEKLYNYIPTDMEGIPILSDRPYKDSQTIFYRYGFFEDNEDYVENGLPMLIGPEGETWQDYQKTYFDLPSWVEDIQPPQVFSDSYLSNQYEVTELLSRTNGGGVYRAKKLSTGEEVVIKEARPHIISYGDVTKGHLRSKEYENACRLQLSGCTPSPIEAVQEWVNHYYVYESIRGEMLDELVNKCNLFTYSCENAAKNRVKFQRFIKVAIQLTETLLYFHKHSIVLNDIHADNFLVTDRGKCYFIDLENVYTDPSERLVGIYNRTCLKEWNQLDGKLADCHKLANLLLYLLGRLEIKPQETFDRIVLDSLLEHFGIVSQFGQVVADLFSSEATIERALEQLQSLVIQPAEYRHELALTPLQDQVETIEITDLLDDRVRHRYHKVDRNPKKFCVLLNRENNRGLGGLSSLLIWMKEGQLPQEYFEAVLEKIQEAIVETEYGEALLFGSECASPYLENGTAGFIKTLLWLDAEKHQQLIERLIPALVAEVAQYSGYLSGMLGISDTLLDVVERLGKEDLLAIVEKQLTVLAIKLTSKPELHSSYHYVFERFKEIKYEFICEKQAV